MKNINNYIIEKLRLDKNTNIQKTKEEIFEDFKKFVFRLPEIFDHTKASIYLENDNKEVFYLDSTMQDDDVLWLYMPSEIAYNSDSNVPDIDEINLEGKYISFSKFNYKFKTESNEYLTINNLPDAVVRSTRSAKRYKLVDIIYFDDNELKEALLQ